MLTSKKIGINYDIEFRINTLTERQGEVENILSELVDLMDAMRRCSCHASTDSVDGLKIVNENLEDMQSCIKIEIDKRKRGVNLIDENCVQKSYLNCQNVKLSESLKLLSIIYDDIRLCGCPLHKDELISINQIYFELCDLQCLIENDLNDIFKLIKQKEKKLEKCRKELSINKKS